MISEESIESLNKYVRRYRERLSRKFNFQDNIHDIFLRLVSQSDPILSSYRKLAEKTNTKLNVLSLNEDDLLVNSFILE